MRMAMMMSAILALLLAGCGGDDSAGTTKDSSGREMTRTKLVLNWFPEMEHGGFYAAQVHGFFAEAGVDVEIVPGGVDIDPVRLVASGQYDFGIANADQVVIGRAAGANVVAVMAPLQISPRCIMVHEASGIESLADLGDMTLAMNQNGAFAQFIIQNYPLKDVQIVRYPGNISVFLNDPGFGQQAYNFSEPFVARENGGDPKVLMLADYGFNPYTSVLIVRDELIRENPDLVRAVTMASVKGWDKYLAEPADTDRLISSLNPEMNPEILGYGVEQMQSMVYTDETRANGTAWMSAARWKTMVEQLEALGIVEPGKVDPASCHDLGFLPK